MTQILINDLFEELLQENNRLLTELTFSQQLLALYQKYRKCLLDLKTNSVSVETIHSIVDTLEVNHRLIEDTIRGRDNEVNYKCINDFINGFDKTSSDKPFEYSSDGCGIDSQLLVNRRVKRRKSNLRCDWPECDYRCTDMTALRNHLKRHTNSKQFICEKCGKSFDNKRYFKEHLAIHAMNEDLSHVIADRTPSPLQSDDFGGHRTADSDHNLNVHTNRENTGLKSTEYESTGGQGLTANDLNKEDSTEGQTKRQKRSYKRIDGKVCCVLWPKCEMTFRKPCEMWDHFKRKHSQDRQFGCDVCDRYFATQRDLKQHKNIHNKSAIEPKGRRLQVQSTSGAFRCPKCEKCFAFKAYLRKHMYRSHYKIRSAPGYESNDESEDKYNKVCDWEGCHQKFITLRELTAHYKSVHQYNHPFKCTHCERRFRFRHLLDRHKAVFHSNRSGKASKYILNCDWEGCGQVFAYNIQLTAHIRRQHTGEKPFECQLCGHRFAIQYYLKKHMFRTHNSTYKCSNCQFSADSGEQLKHHYRTNPECKKYKCYYCAASFTSISSLNYHFNSIHTTEKPFQCSELGCVKRFATKTRLRLHIQNQHLKIRSHVCEWPGCGKGYFNATALKCHKRLHSNNREFICDYNECEKAFTTQTALDLHKQSHLSVKRFLCLWPGCSQSFTTKTGLETHVNRHNGLRPFRCALEGCDRAYYRRVNLYKHFNCKHKLSVNEVKTILSVNEI